MDIDVESLRKSTDITIDTPDDGTCLTDTPEDSTSLAPLITNFPPSEANKPICRRRITDLAATREFADQLDESAIHCLGRDLWSVRSASDAMVLLTDQRQMTEGMKLLLARDIEAVATQGEERNYHSMMIILGVLFCFILFFRFILLSSSEADPFFADIETAASPDPPRHPC
ncbi:hypothetical protein QBC33DRAFT_566307, partial [Phialemonium atrogriseum]